MATFSANPLDGDDFDPVQYINERFPTEASLDDLDEFISNIGSQISSMDEEISKAVQSQSIVGKQASRDIKDAQQSIDDLFEQIGEIKLKASQSETMVQEICADIKKLDNAKNHMQTSITSLNRLQMLINAVNQLEILAREYEYKDVANLLDAVKQFMSHFDSYLHIPVIADIKKRVDGVKNFLTNHIRKAFRDLAKMVETVADVEVALSTRPDMPHGLKSLADSCTVVDALGATTRRQLLVEFVQAQLVTYDNSFSHGHEYAALEHMDRRWAWCRRTLKYVDSKFATIFPAHWRVPLRLCLEFTERTKMHLAAVLTEMESKDAMDVHSLLKALQSTLRFQTEMSTERFNLQAELQRSKANEQQREKVRLGEQQMQLKLKKDNKLMYVLTDHISANADDESESGFLNLAHTAISGGISGMFDKFLSCYVSFERQNLEDLLHRLSQEEDNAESGGGGGEGGGGGGSHSGGDTAKVFGSSTSMFVYIKNSIKRCTALTTGQTFFALSNEFKVCMQQYVELLRNRCPIGVTVGVLGIGGGGAAGAVAGQTAVSADGAQLVIYRLPAGMETTICYLLNTGEYCAEVVPQLEQMVQAKMQPETLAAKVDFSAEADEFLDLVAFCLKILTSGVMDRLEPAFKAMKGLPWGTMDQVGEESSYLHTCNQVLLETMPKIRAALASSYYNNFCTKLASEILQRYQSVIIKQKKISEMATQQLLLDTYNIKTLLLQLHVLSSEPGSSASSVSSAYLPSAMYTKLISNKIAHIEMLLKLVGTPDELLLERFRIMWPEGSPTDLQLLMTLKGMKRNDQQAILEMFGLSVSGAAKAKWAANNTQQQQLQRQINGSSNTANKPQQASGVGQPAPVYTAAAAAASRATELAATQMKSFTQDMKNSMMGQWGGNKAGSSN